MDWVEGAEKLTGVFGYWPVFHDAEVLWMHLDQRPARDNTYGPTLETLCRVFEVTGEVNSDGASVLRHNVLVHLRFHEVTELRIEGFLPQNRLHGLSIIDIRQHQLDRAHFEVRFDSDLGVDAAFQCLRAEVVDVRPWTNEDVLSPG